MFNLKSIDFSTVFTSVTTYVRNVLRVVYQIVRDTVHSFSRSAAVEATAGLAYFSFFSFFPLLLILVAAASSWLTEEAARYHAMDYFTDIFPISPDLVQAMLQTLVDQRVSSTLVSGIGLLWAASGYFNLLVRNVNRAWPDLKPRPFVRTRLEALGIVVLLGMLFIVSIIATSAVELMDALNLPLWEELFNSVPLRRVLSNLFPMIVRLCLLWGLYYWVPKTRVDWRASLISASIVTAGWRLITAVLTWYLSSRFAHYNVVYGSLGTTIASLMWLYFSNYILVLGAHLTASIARNWGILQHRLTVGATPPHWYFRKHLPTHQDRLD